MRVRPQDQKQSVDCERYPPANLTGDWGAPGYTAGGREPRLEGTNENIILVVNNAVRIMCCIVSIDSKIN